MSKVNANIEINVIFADGSQRSAVISQSAVSLVKCYARLMPSLFEGTGFNPLNADASNIVAITRADNDTLHQIPHARQKAIFHLGQMDMQASVCDMLRTMANGAADGIRPGLALAADLVESMEVPNANG